MEMPDGKQRQPDVDLSEAVIWYMRSKAKHLPVEEMHEFESWLQRSPENATVLLTLAEREHRVTARRRSASRLRRVPAYLLAKIGLLAAALCAVAGWMFLH